MPTSKVLTEFYLIAEELDKNILLFNELEKKLEEAKKNNDMALAEKLLRKYIKLDLTLSKFVVKPILATTIMSIISYFIYFVLSGIIVERLATIIAITLAVIIYVICIAILRIFTKEEIKMLPSGEKILKILEKLKIY